METRKWISTVAGLDDHIKALVNSLKIPRPAAMFMAARGIKPEQSESFLSPKLSELSDPYRFPDMEKATARLWQAIGKGEAILIHGDYDTDGVTSCALLAGVLRKNGAEVYAFIPHRFEDGYGFTPDSLAKACEACPRECSVLVTVDCGITSCDAVLEAKKRNIDVIVTDHHEPGSQLPEALALINPKTNPELSDLELLSGAGVAFKLAHAFVKYGREHRLGAMTTKLKNSLDLVALGTVADIVPLLGENRIMVRHGLDVLKKQLRPGIRALFESVSINGPLRPSDVTFKLAPRLNAAGRVGNAQVALKLLESKNIVHAYEQADALDKFNRIRQEKEQQIFQEALEQLERRGGIDEKFSLLAAGRNWHQGVIGIVASRLARQFNRPAIVLTINEDGEAHGSGRGIAGINLMQILEKSASYLTRYGGHPMAVGIGLNENNIEDFATEFENQVRRCLCRDDLNEKMHYDGELHLQELSDDFFAVLDDLGPFGHSNPNPLFRFNDISFERIIPLGDKHCRGTLKNSRSDSKMNFVAFNIKAPELAGSVFDILAVPQINEYRGVRSAQLQLMDIRAIY